MVQKRVNFARSRRIDALEHETLDAAPNQVHSREMNGSCAFYSKPNFCTSVILRSWLLALEISEGASERLVLHHWYWVESAPFL